MISVQGSHNLPVDWCRKDEDLLRQLLSQYPLHAETQYVLDGEKGQRQWKPKIETSFLGEESYVTYIVEGQEKVRPVQLNREKSNLSSSFFFPHNFARQNRGMWAFQWRRQRHRSLDFSLILIATILWGLQMHSAPKRAKASCLLKWEMIRILILKLVLKGKSYKALIESLIHTATNPLFRLYVKRHCNFFLKFYLF